MVVCCILTACKEAYTDGDSEAACAFGCQSQLPAIETRRKQVICQFWFASFENMTYVLAV